MDIRAFFEAKTYHTVLPTMRILELYYDKEKFESLCRKCPHYGTIWTCPPLAFDPEFIWGSYDNIEIICDKIVFKAEQIESDSQSELIRGEESVEAVKQSVHREAKKQLETRLLLTEEKRSQTRALFPGTCNQCKECQRTLRKPCISPSSIRYSIEALGGDVAKLLEEEFGLSFDWSDIGQLPKHYLLVGGILF